VPGGGLAEAQESVRSQGLKGMYIVIRCIPRILSRFYTHRFHLALQGGGSGGRACPPHGKLMKFKCEFRCPAKPFEAARNGSAKLRKAYRSLFVKALLVVIYKILDPCGHAHVTMRCLSITWVLVVYVSMCTASQCGHRRYDPLKQACCSCGATLPLSVVPMVAGCPAHCVDVRQVKKRGRSGAARGAVTLAAP